jgi:hypothetical protein
VTSDDIISSAAAGTLRLRDAIANLLRQPPVCAPPVLPEAPLACWQVTSALLRVFIHLFIYIYLYIYIYNVYVGVYKFLCLYIYICIYIHIYTHLFKKHQTHRYFFLLSYAMVQANVNRGLLASCECRHLLLTFTLSRLCRSWTRFAGQHVLCVQQSIWDSRKVLNLLQPHNC